MDDQDRQAIEQLFVKLRTVEGRAGPRDAEAEALIRSRMAAQPGASYYLAQTVVMQELALEAANRRIEDLEREARQPSGGGFLSGLFGGRQQQSPRYDRRDAGPAYPPRSAPWGQPAGGGFLAGAAQTAMGVAGGVVLGNLLAGALFGDGGAHAATASGDAGGSDSTASTQATQGDDSDNDLGDGGDFGGDFDVAGDF